MKKGVLALMLTLVMAACADTGTVRDAPSETGVNRVYPRKYEAVKAATLDTIAALNVSVTSSEEKPEGLVVLVAKPANFFSWGEVGRVTVEKSEGEKTPVRVYWEKRSRMQITGTSQNEFADELFRGIDDVLRRMPR